jgi:hypothetical protein
MTNFLLVLILLQFKHLIADFFLQSSYILDNRKIYGHPGGILHVAIHAAGSIAAFWIMGTDWWTMFVVVIVEVLIHYHLDWAKDNFVAKRGLTTVDKLFWYALGVDQAIHQLTYVLMAQFWYMAQ